MDVHVVSTTLDPAAHPDVTIVSEDVIGSVAALRARAGKDIWLFGGGVLFRSLLEAALVDRVEVAVVPALLGSGVPLLPGVREIATLALHSSEELPSGMILLKYEVASPEARHPERPHASAPLD